MKKFMITLMAATLAVMGYARVPVGEAFQPVKLQAGAPTAMQVTGKIDAPRTINNSNKLMAPGRAESDYVVISEQPAGEKKTYLRGGGQYYVSNSSLYYRDQSGTIDIVFGEDNKVYFKDIISGLAYGTWVEATINEEGTLITMPLNQNLRYVSTYDACIATKALRYDSSSGFAVDESITELTFNVADGVISMQGTAFADLSLAGVWTDDGTIQNYGDYASVYTPYTPDLNLVELPEGLTAVEMPISGKFYASVSSDAVDYSGTVQVARDGDTFYFKGIAAEFPDAWVKGELVDGEVSIPVTYLGELDGTNVWACGYSSSGPVNISFIFDEELNTFEIDGYFMLNPNELSMNVSALMGYYQALFIGTRPDPITPPADLETEAMPFEGDIYDGSSTTGISGMVQVGRDGDDVYIQGLIQELPEGWIKGTFQEDGTVVFPYGQYVGLGEYGSIYAVGDAEDDEGNTGIGDIVFAYDEARNVYTLQNNIFASGKKDKIYYYSELSNIIIGVLSDEIWVASQQGFENTAAVTETQIGESVLGVFAQGEAASLVPKYYANGEAVRMYAGNTLTISSEKTMAKIVITMTGSAAQMRLEANVGEYELDGSDGTWTGEANEVIFSVPSGSQARITKIQIFYLDYSTMVVEAPEDLVVESYILKATDTYYDKEVSYEVKVGFKDDFVYIQGLSTYIPDGWVRGTMAAADATTGGEGAPRRVDGPAIVSIPNWKLGTYDSWFGSMDLAFSGATFTYDPESDQFYSQDGFQSLDDDDNAWDEVAEVTISKIVETAATPADPSVTGFAALDVTYPRVNFNIPQEDVDGNALLSEKLSYVILVEKETGVEELTLTKDLYTNFTEDLTEIPYNFTDDYDIYAGGSTVYLNQDVETEMKTWKKIGVQSIYRGLGEEHRSNIGWYDLTEYWGATGINDITVDNDANARYFDLQGREVRKGAQGIIIKVAGNKAVKVLNK